MSVYRFKKRYKIQNTLDIVNMANSELFHKVNRSIFTLCTLKS